MSSLSSENLPLVFETLYLIAEDRVEDGMCASSRRRRAHAARQDAAWYDVKVWPLIFLSRILLPKINEHIYVSV